MNQEYMKTRKILPLVLSMSLPMVISMAVNALYNIVDSYFVAKISEDAMTALSLVFPIQNFINAVAIGFGVGINAMIALYLGAGRRDTSDQQAYHGDFHISNRLIHFFKSQIHTKNNRKRKYNRCITYPQCDHICICGK